ncbi:CMGC family protein kinase [Histomonas meleagridis]|uniref:CMGC family protein kinase n=1 Tax=Histomonas meleagridis TaxID=135588 RepID=UPI003559BF08|nr:CMGC family protein kinase [Histomonas meleagridis]KAH0802749.1 CMGC family protein kinase [Histomonas meleagridis]
MEIGRKRKRIPAGGERKVYDHLPMIPYLDFGECVGQGHFSHVYKALYKKEHLAAVKIVERGSERLIKNEIQLLQELKGAPHIVQLYEVIEQEQTLLVFEYLQSIDQSQIFAHLSLNRLRFLLSSVLEGLAAAHALGIVHRDVKIGNINISPHFKDVKLLDWGCGIHVSNDMSSKAGSRQCRSPEMLMGYRDYGTGCDTWAVGIFIIYLLSNGNIPWKARTTVLALKEMTHYFGGRNFMEIAHKLNLVITPEMEEDWVQEPDKQIESCFSPQLKHLQDPDLIDLMHKLLNLNIKKRISAEQALQHPFFKKSK